MSLREGQVFAGYRVQRLLGSGGMGEVYLVKHPRLPRLDALKVLRVDVSANPDYRARFEREADLASTLWHPNIVGVHDRGEYDGHLWISMDFVDGSDAGHLLAQRYPNGMQIRDVCAITTSVASALDYAHKRGLLHRDVKPANIMIADDDHGDRRIMLADFGVARAIGDVSGLTETNMTVGTVAYCAPEQLMGEDLDGRADQYALAATCYQLLTGFTLFPHSNAAVVISRHLNSDPPSVAASRPELTAVNTVLQTALAKNPEDRFSSVSEFALELREAAEQGPRPSPVAATVAAPKAARTPPRNSPTPPELAAKPPRSQRTTALAVGAAVVAILALIAAVWRPWTADDASSDESSVPSTTSQATPSLVPLPQPPIAAPAPPPRPATTTSSEPSPPPTTDVVTAFAVNSSGLPAAGYTVEQAGPRRATLSECSQPSVSAVRPGIYSCYPFAASATTCWPSPPDAMLCLDDPWGKQLTRFDFATSALLPVQPKSTPEPLAVVLDDGSQCGILIGGARGRTDGTTPLYGCEGGDRPPIVVGPGEAGGGIERTSPAWTAWVAEENEPMQERRVVTAIFAG